jgi:predicted ATPase
MIGSYDAQGSVWHRWDPHLHAPGTILNDQYQGDDAWEQFLSRIEASDPPIRALGITDYFSVEVYQAALAKKREGRLASVDLIFPNIEMRYGIGTDKGSPINVHLLVSPADREHVEQIRRLLRAFTFDAYGESFRCERDDLIRLGRAYDNSLKAEDAALAAGTNQFKVNPDQLRHEWTRSAWVRDNVLIAVAAGAKDGTAGLKNEASLATLRKEIERNAHIIFSAQPKQREFWLGRGAATVEKLNSDWGGCKPCLHGSDAHDLEHVGIPDLNRNCWIKGDLSFESLRQACLEPDMRTFIGDLPPRGALPSQVIKSVAVTNAPWLKTLNLPLNSGLVGIIGARGSGKTALADIIAAGGFALLPHLNERSFIRRAREHLGESAAEIVWEEGDPTSNRLQHIEIEEFLESPRVQYLSQQFVDALCSAEGVTDELIAEIERVIYQAHPIEDRMGTTTFRELLDLRAARGRTLRQNHEEMLVEAARELNVQRDRRTSLPGLERQRGEKAASIAKDKKDRGTLIGKGREERAARLDAISTAAELVRFRIEQARRCRQTVLSLKDDVADTRSNKAPLRLRQLQQTYAEARLSAENWTAFLLDFKGDVDGILTAAIKALDEKIRTLVGPAAGEVTIAAGETPSKSLLIRDDVVLEDQTLSLLNKEVARLRALIGVDAEQAKAFARLSEKISRDEAAVAKLDREIELAKKAEGRISELIQARRDHYAAVFDGIIEEEKELSDLYEPLRSRLETEEGALGKLSFSIRRSVDVAGWAERGENLLDLRKNGPFRGRGALLEAAKASLLTAWEGGSSSDVAEAMAKFREAHERNLVEHAPVARSDVQQFRQWASQISAWLYGTEHIRIVYGIQYEGVNIEQLSPGNRGIVLLLLYLAIDRDDDRPLIIDQPEENLDPKSIHQELVTRFRSAKLRRQIIIVTHNANLIVNGDADQVIVASCGPHRPGELPEISYESGSLENSVIRRQVCEILEGGEAAFRERAMRLRVRLEPGRGQ